MNPSTSPLSQVSAELLINSFLSKEQVHGSSRPCKIFNPSTLASLVRSALPELAAHSCGRLGASALRP